MTNQPQIIRITHGHHAGRVALTTSTAPKGAVYARVADQIDAAIWGKCSCHRIEAGHYQPMEAETVEFNRRDKK